MSLPKLTKDQVQKLTFSAIGFVFLLYVYFTFFLGPLNRSRAAMLVTIQDLQSKLDASKDKMKKAVSLEQQAKTATSRFAALRALNPEGAPIAWFPPRIKTFFASQQIDKAVARLDNSAAFKEAELSGWTKYNLVDRLAPGRLCFNWDGHRRAGKYRAVAFDYEAAYPDSGKPAAISACRTRRCQHHRKTMKAFASILIPILLALGALHAADAPAIGIKTISRSKTNLPSNWRSPAAILFGPSVGNQPPRSRAQALSTTPAVRIFRSRPLLLPPSPSIAERASPSSTAGSWKKASNSVCRWALILTRSRSSSIQDGRVILERRRTQEIVVPLRRK